MALKMKSSLQSAWWKLTKSPLPPGALVTMVDITNPALYMGGSRDAIVSYNSSNFLQRKQRGELMFNGVTIEKLRRSSASTKLTMGPFPNYGTLVYEGAWDVLWAAERPYTYPAIVNTLKGDADKIAAVKAFSEIEKAPMAVLVTAAEMRKTISMLAHPFAKADKLLTGMLKRKASLLRKGMEAGSAITNAWLEYRLGWKPVVYDLKNIAEATAQASHHYFLPERKVARGGKRFAHQSSVTDYGTNNNVQTSLRIATGYLEYRANVGIYYTISDDSFLAAEARRLGFRLSDIPGAAWELTPLSFVVDRFVMVGDWLNAITPKPGVHILGSWLTTVTDDRKSHHFTVSNTLGSPPATYTGTVGPFLQNTVTIRRTLSPTLPVVPPLNMGELNLEQHLDHLALLLEKFKLFKSTR